MRKKEDLAFEDALSDVLAGREELVEVPLTNRVIWFAGFAIFLASFVVIGRFVFIARGFDAYQDQSRRNLMRYQELVPPRGMIYDRFGTVLAENRPTFVLFLNLKQFLSRKDKEKKILSELEEILGLAPDEVRRMIQESDPAQRGGKVLLVDDVTQTQLIKLKSVNEEALEIESGFRREYPKGSTYVSLIGYTGSVNSDDLKNDPNLSAQAVVGRAGIEGFYDKSLRGEAGSITQIRNAKGEVLSDPQVKEPTIGKPLHLTIDAEFQSYFVKRFEEGLRALGRTTGVGMAMNPQTGEVLALFNFPLYDNNIFSASGRNDEKREVLNSPLHPLFNRAVAGFYNPGSTIKPMVGVAALKEEVITPQREIFSPGYLDVPNPYDPEKPTRFLDWRYQGLVDLGAAIAQSSNVYFYTVGGGFGDIKGLGISRLHDWWEKFGLGKASGIDITGEANGFLPNAEEKEKKTGTPWLLGDTYNVSIGQGDLLLTPIQILNYISTIGNGGKLYRPFLNREMETKKILADLSDLGPYIRQVQKGMIKAVESPLGTAHLLADLPFQIGAKTGSAQVQNNAQENAFFVGYAPTGNPEIAILVLIEHSREGSLNTLPIAKDALKWYYEHRIERTSNIRDTHSL